jgi:hypothetical protein
MLMRMYEFRGNRLRERNYVYAYTVKRYDILKVKNALMNSVYHVTEYAVSSIVSSSIVIKAGHSQPERFRRVCLQE